MKQATNYIKKTNKNCAKISSSSTSHLSQKNMPHSQINIKVDRMTRRNHVTILELHRFCTLGPELPTYNNLEIKRFINTYSKCVI
jgi:hypothetical protein